jgi:Ca-activated chloride channel family protein
LAEVESDAAGTPATSTLATSTLATASTGGTAAPNDAPYGDVFFKGYGTNPFIDTEDDHLSTFGLDVDTASYSVVRRYLNDGHLPPSDAVRVEELVNYFDYGDTPPQGAEFALHAEGAPSPFATGDRYYLLRFNLRGRDVAAKDRPPAMLTFVVDVSGSMARENRLGLVKRALGLLLDGLRADDRISLVVYGSRGRIVLEPTNHHETIRRAIMELRPEGSTNAGEGLRLAYELAARHRQAGAIHRVILCSDGVANMGSTSAESILKQVRGEAQKGIELTTVGFGMGNYNDILMEQLADHGNGRYAYVDTLDEAHRIFVEDLTGTLMTLAAEARSQVEFNPEVVARYRLLGYENRDIADQRFRDDTVDAGEIGVGHTVTVLYEIKLHQEPSRRRTAGLEIATLRLRYGSVAHGEMVELERTVTGRDLVHRWEKASPALRLTSLVAEFAEILKGTYWAREGDLETVFRQAQRVSAEFVGNRDVAEFVSLAGKAAEFKKRQ